jgi:hypothetical protein
MSNKVYKINVHGPSNRTVTFPKTNYSHYTREELPDGTVIYRPLIRGDIL